MGSVLDDYPEYNEPDASYLAPVASVSGMENVLATNLGQAINPEIAQPPQSSGSATMTPEQIALQQQQEQQLAANTGMGGNPMGSGAGAGAGGGGGMGGTA